MSETQQTTAERIAELILRSVEQSIIDFDHVFNADPVAHAIAAEVDALRRERDSLDRGIAGMGAANDALRAEVVDLKLELVDRNTRLTMARAEVERLRPAAEAWEALETLRPMFNAPLPASAEAERNHYAAIEAADQKYQAAAARAREAAEEGR